MAKLGAYGFDNNSLSFVRSYLANRIQRRKIENHFSNWREITTGVPLGSILGPLLFNIFTNDIFVFAESSNVCNYVNDNTLFTFGKTFDEVTRKLQNDFLILDESSETGWLSNRKFKSTYFFYQYILNIRSRTTLPRHWLNLQEKLYILGC